MDLLSADKLIKRLIETGLKHQDYQRTVDLAETYRIYITGQDMHKKMIRYVPREDAEAFVQRCAITRAITPAIASSVRKPFAKVTRNNRVRYGFKFDETNDQAITNVQKMIDQFFGDPGQTDKGLSYYLNTRFTELSFIDPNSWIVLEWDAPESQTDVIIPRPFEVSAAEAVNFNIVNDVVKWLFVKQAITFDQLIPATDNQNNPNNVPGVVYPTSQSVVGIKYTLYDQDLTIVFAQVDPNGPDAQSNLAVVNENQDVILEYVTIGNATYKKSVFYPNLGYVPAFRVGYERDDATNGRTFVNPWHAGLCYFDKSVKTVSELDLTMCLHAFPQKIQYVLKCNGPAKNQRCNSGLLVDGTECPACKGTGFKKISNTTQDAVSVPMPDDAADMMDLDKLVVYKTPGIDILNFQESYIDNLETKVHQAVFNSQMFLKKQATNTATEIDTNTESVYDALFPFAQKYSQLWQAFVLLFVKLAGQDIAKANVFHQFPADFKLKSNSVLIAERKAAMDAGSPGFLLDAIDEDLAMITYSGDPDGLREYMTRQLYFPFTGFTPDEIMMLLSSEFVPKYSKVLYSNFSQIFKELQMQNPDFYAMDNKKQQAQLVSDKVNEYIDNLDSQAPKLTVNTFTNNIPVKNQPNNNQDGGNPGNANNGATVKNPPPVTQVA